MKTFIRGLIAVLFLLSVTGIYGQDEIYNEKQKKEISIDTNEAKVNEKDLNSYTTEKDYQEQQHKNKELEVFTEERRKEKERKKDSSVAVQVAAEIVLEVFIHTVFIVATLWN